MGCKYQNKKAKLRQYIIKLIFGMLRTENLATFNRFFVANEKASKQPLPFSHERIASNSPFILLPEFNEVTVSLPPTWPVGLSLVKLVTMPNTAQTMVKKARLVPLNIDTLAWFLWSIIS